MKIGILREGKEPPDRRVPFTPAHCATIICQYPQINFVVQPSPIRCYTDEEYSDQGITLQEDLSDCDVLFGVKEVPIDDLIKGKIYFYFSHTHKLQPYNQNLIQAILDKKITHIDYECLLYPNDRRVIGFGRYAGLVGAYNGLKTYGEKYDLFQLKRVTDCHDLDELIAELGRIKLGNIKILLTGSGRVANGAIEILETANIRRVNVEEYLTGEYGETVYCGIQAKDYVSLGDGSDFDFLHFIKNGGDYKSTFSRYSKVSDLLIAGHYWDNASPVFFTKEDAAKDDFKIRVIADISCDIAGPIPSTIRPSTIAHPVYDYNRMTGLEEERYSDPDNISVMAVDNLPCELPVDASKGFGDVLLAHILPLVINGDKDQILEKASITNSDGDLTKRYEYMREFVEGDGTEK